MKEAIKNIAYASVLGAASMLGATQSNADVINITNSSNTDGIGGQQAVINFIDDPAVTNGYDERLDNLFTPREPAHPLDRYFTLSQNVDGHSLESDYRPLAELGDTYIFDITAINDSKEEFNAENHLDFTGTTLDNNPNGVTDFNYIAAFDTDLDGFFDKRIEGSVMDAIEENDGKTESWDQYITPNFDATQGDSYGRMQFTAVPEPSTLALYLGAGLGAAGIGLLQSSRRKDKDS